MISGIITLSRSKIGTLINTNKQKTYLALGLNRKLLSRNRYTPLFVYTGFIDTVNSVFRKCFMLRCWLKR